MEIKEIKELIELIQRSAVEEFEMETSGVRIRFRKSLAPATVASAPGAVLLNPVETETLQEIAAESEAEARVERLTRSCQNNFA